MRLLPCLLAMMFLGACGTPPDMHAVGIGVSQLERLDRKHYKVYVTFLSSKNLAGDALRQDRVARLRKSFDDFAYGIGADAVAIWIGPPLGKDWQELAKGVHDRYRLGYSHGPYLIVSNASPTSEASAAQPRVVLDFSDTSPERIQVVLDELQQQVRSSAISTDKLFLVHSYEIVMSKFGDYSGVARELIKALLERK